MSAQPKNVKEILDAGAQYLARMGVQKPRLVCELLAARLLQCNRLELYLRYDECLGAAHLAAMRRGVKRVAECEPVQYVVGETGFMGHTFKTDRRALIPRPETELLVEQVLAYSSLWEIDRPKILDIGTGSGCIVCSLALARPDAEYSAFDVSREALELAGENAASLGVSEGISFSSDELAEVIEPQTANAVVSNPPYIPAEACDQLPAHIRDFEPRMALDGGADGLSVTKGIIQDAAIVLAPHGVLFLEIGETQAAAVTALLTSEGFTAITVIPDLAGRDRIVRATMPE